MSEKSKISVGSIEERTVHDWWCPCCLRSNESYVSVDIEDILKCKHCKEEVQVTK